MKTDKTDNEIIAEFMGEVVFQKRPRHYIGVTENMKPYKLADKLKYNTSWDWLMPVVEKIAENYDFTIQFYNGDCNCYCTKQSFDASDIPGIGHGGFKPNIKSVYKSVVAFCKWYNQQSK